MMSLFELYTVLIAILLMSRDFVVLALIPSPCTTNCLTTSDTCDIADNLCHCTNLLTLSKVGDCIKSNCTGDEVTAGFQYIKSICDSVGISLNIDIPTPTPSANATSPTNSASTTPLNHNSTTTTPFHTQSNLTKSSGNNSQYQPKPLSTSTISLIVTGCLIGCVGLAGLWCFIRARHRRTRQMGHDHGQSNDDPFNPQPEMRAASALPMNALSTPASQMMPQAGPSTLPGREVASVHRTGTPTSQAHSPTSEEEEVASSQSSIQLVPRTNSAFSVDQDVSLPKTNNQSDIAPPSYGAVMFSDTPYDTSDSSSPTASGSSSTPAPKAPDRTKNAILYQFFASHPSVFKPMDRSILDSICRSGYMPYMDPDLVKLDEWEQAGVGVYVVGILRDLYRKRQDEGEASGSHS